MIRAQAIVIARHHALANALNDPSLPQTLPEARVWNPPEWVISAIQNTAGDQMVPTRWTHNCGACGFLYAPRPGESEDCPRCGYDGGFSTAG